MIPVFISKISKKILEKNSLFNLPKKDIFIVLGESRSGTSLIMELFKESGVFIGYDKDLKKPDEGNPRGYFEHKKVINLTRRLLKQINYNDKSLVKKLQLFITKIRINKFLVELYNQANDSLALKIRPLVFTLWQQYIPNFKLFITYRHPLITAHSNIKLKNSKMPFHEYILRWEGFYREFIYYYGKYPSIVINYDDLLNPDKQNGALRKLVDFTTRGNLNILKKVISPNLNRSSKEIKKIMDIYPLSQSTNEVLKTLEKIKA